MLDSKIPEGPLADKWTKYKDDIQLVNPANKRSIDVIVVGTGLAGSSAAASLAEMGVQCQGAVLPRFPTTSSLNRCSGRNQRCEKLSKRWGLGAPLIL